MLIVGAKGFAKEVLEVLHQLKDIDNLVFYDDVNKNIASKLYDRFAILKNIIEAELFFKEKDDRFTLGIGNPIMRKELNYKFTSLGGKLVSTISPLASIGHFGNTIESGCNIMSGTVITNDIIIKKGTLINLNCTIGHDSKIGKFVELSPGVHISGNCTIGNFTFIGTNATVLPKIRVGKNVIVAAGSVVTKNVPDSCMVAGVPAVVKKHFNND